MTLGNLISVTTTRLVNSGHLRLYQVAGWIYCHEIKWLRTKIKCFGRKYWNLSIQVPVSSFFFFIRFLLIFLQNCLQNICPWIWCNLRDCSLGGGECCRSQPGNQWPEPECGHWPVQPRPAPRAEHGEWREHHRWPQSEHYSPATSILVTNKLLLWLVCTFSFQLYF